MEETPAVMPELWEVPPSPQRPSGPVDPLADVTPFSPPAQRETSKLSKRERLALQLSPVQPSPAGTKRKRQLRFADEEMQIPKVKIRSNMMAGTETCRPFELAAAEPARAVNLLSRPSRKDFSHRRFLPLWKRNCKTRHADETDSERAMPVWTVPDLRLETSSDSAGMQSPPAMALMDITLSPVPEREEPKEGEEILAGGPEMVVDLIPPIAAETEPRGSLPKGRDISEMSVERAREISSLMERSRLLDVSSLHERLSRDRISGEAPSLSRSREASYLSSDSLTLRKGPSLSPGQRSREPKVSTAEISLMDDLLEVSEEREIMGAEIQPLSPIADTLGVPTTQPLSRSPLHQQLLRSISSRTAKAEWTTFSQLCPPFKTTRPQAAKIFSHLLDLLKQQALVAKQEEAYGEIFIGRQRGGVK